MSEPREHPTISAARLERIAREKEDRKARVGAQMDALYRCFQSDDWKEARRYLELRLEGYRDMLEGSKVTEIDAAWWRGAIAELRHILGVADGDRAKLQGAALDLLTNKETDR